MFDQPTKELAGNEFNPVYLPEVGKSVSWFMCRNPACENFGHPFEGSEGSSDAKGNTDQRYRIDLKQKRMQCKRCGMSFGLKSNLAIRPLVRYYLEQSLPFADCPNLDCANHGYNAFEHYMEPGSVYKRKRAGPALYRKQGEHRVSCRECHTRLYLGNALHLKTDEHIDEIVKGVFAKRETTITLDQLRISVGSYYSNLRRIAARLRDWHVYQNAHLLQRKYTKWPAPLKIYADTIRVSLQRLGEGNRSQYLNIVATVVKIEDSCFVLAVHPAFLPTDYCPDLFTVMEEIDSPYPHLNAWDCLDSGFGSPLSADVRTVQNSLSDLSRDGYFTISPYSELAHFLVVSKLLSRFPKIHLYVDGSLPLWTAAVTAFEEDIRDGRVEIVLFQHDKDPYKKRRKRSRSKKAGKLNRAWNAVLSELENRVDGEHSNNPQEYAKAYRSAFRGAYSKLGDWAWLPIKSPSGQYKHPRILWLTWNPSKKFESIGADLLADSTLQPVDSVANSFRSRNRSLARPSTSAEQRRSFAASYIDPLNVLSELWISTMGFNFLTEKRDEEMPRAVDLRLVGSAGYSTTKQEIAESFRLSVKQAEKMTKWVSR